MAAVFGAFAMRSLAGEIEARATHALARRAANAGAELAENVMTTELGNFAAEVVRDRTGVQLDTRYIAGRPTLAGVAVTAAYRFRPMIGQSGAEDLTQGRMPLPHILRQLGVNARAIAATNRARIMQEATSEGN